MQRVQHISTNHFVFLQVFKGFGWIERLTLTEDGDILIQGFSAVSNFNPSQSDGFSQIHAISMESSILYFEGLQVNFYKMMYLCP